MALTDKQLNDWAYKEGNRLAFAVHLAREKATEEQVRVNAYIMPIFNRYKFPVIKSEYRREGFYVEHPDKLYLCDDEDLVQFYFSEVNQAHRDHGFLGTPGQCPALLAKHEVVKAENALLESGMKMMGLAPDDHSVTPVLRERFLATLLASCEAK